MEKFYNLTTAKAKLSSIVGEVEYGKKEVIITRKGKSVAVIIPFDEYEEKVKGKREEKGLINARGALSHVDEVEDMVENIYRARKGATDRKVEF